MNPEWTIDGRRFTTPDFASITDGIENLSAASRILVRTSDPALFYAVLSATERKDAFLFAVPDTQSDAFTDSIAESAAVELVITGTADRPVVRAGTGAGGDASAGGGRDAGGICIFTTGTTGGPKGVVHSWDTIAASSRFVPGGLAGAVWWLAYQMMSYAGLQVYFSARRSGGTLVAESVREPDRVARAIVESGVNVLSATPTYWRWLIQGWPAGLDRPRLQRATLGGEVVTQQTIDLVRDAFRPEGITHIYASSEAGTAIVVSDGLAGFPTVPEGRAGSGAAWRVEGNELFVRTPASMTGYWQGAEQVDDWIATGDLVEERDGRYHFSGRADGRINAGGAKVSPERVEEALETLPGVRAALVYGKESPIVGELLAADIEWEGASPLEPRSIREALAKMLASHEIPPYIRTVDRIPMSENGKKLRV